jgi:hypothetical protein
MVAAEFVYRDYDCISCLAITDRGIITAKLPTTRNVGSSLTQGSKPEPYQGRQNTRFVDNQTRIKLINAEITISIGKFRPKYWFFVEIPHTVFLFNTLPAAGILCDITQNAVITRIRGMTLRPRNRHWEGEKRPGRNQAATGCG